MSAEYFSSWRHHLFFLFYSWGTAAAYTILSTSSEADSRLSLDVRYNFVKCSWVLDQYVLWAGEVGNCPEHLKIETKSTA